jgi:hypothetical protein
VNTITWELLVGAGLLILGQGGVLHLSLRRHVNGMADTVKEIKVDTRQLLEGQYQLDTRVSLLESDVTHIKEQL